MKTLQHVRVYVDDIEKTAKALGMAESTVRRAAVRAINESTAAGQTTIVREVRDFYTLSASTVRSTMRRKKADSKNLIGRVISSSNRLPVHLFKHKPSVNAGDTTGSNQKDIRVAIRKNGLRSLGTGLVWNERIYMRIPKQMTRKTHTKKGTAVKREAITKVFGPSVPELVRAETVTTNVRNRMQNVFMNRLEHHVGREIDKMMKGGSK